jgi:hypothetical protein
MNEFNVNLKPGWLSRQLKKAHRQGKLIKIVMNTTSIRGMDRLLKLWNESNGKRVSKLIKIKGNK